MSNEEPKATSDYDRFYAKREALCRNAEEYGDEKFCMDVIAAGRVVDAAYVRWEQAVKGREYSANAIAELAMEGRTDEESVMILTADFGERTPDNKHDLLGVVVHQLTGRVVELATVAAAIIEGWVNVTAQGMGCSLDVSYRRTGDGEKDFDVSWKLRNGREKAEIGISEIPADREGQGEEILAALYEKIDLERECSVSFWGEEPPSDAEVAAFEKAKADAFDKIFRKPLLSHGTADIAVVKKRGARQ